MKSSSHTPAHSFTHLSMKKTIRSAVFVFTAIAAITGVGYAQVTLADFGAAKPSPGPNDISQLSTSGNTTSPDGLNYYSNNHVDYHNGGEPGQTFTTGTSPAGYVMTSIFLKTAGLGNNSGIGSPATYYLHIFSVSGSSATLLQTYTATISSFTDGDWLRWTNLGVAMATNANYAWSFGLTSNSGYEPMGVASGNKYAGGEIALVPVAGGTMTFGSSHNYDAVFDIVMSTNSSLLLAGAPTISPALTNYIGDTITLGSAAAGDPPLGYQWQMAGSTGSLTNIPNATNSSLTLTPTTTNAFRFDYIATNITGRATSSVVVATIIVGSPIISPASTLYIGSPVTLTSPADGNSLTYQWQADGGSGGSRTNIPSATSVSLTVTPPSTGTFKFDYIVNNGSGSFTSSVASVTILSPAAVTINASQTMAAMPLEGLGVASAVYDGYLTSSGTASALVNAGIKIVRYPGGSYADIVHWATCSSCGGYTAPGACFDSFINNLVTPAGATAIITVNYGSNPTCDGGGDTNEAAAWVAHANMTNHLGVKYWEIGNEQGGNGYYGTTLDWEEDLHYPEAPASSRVGQPLLSPTAYGSNSLMFIRAMKAQDPTIKCGVGFDTGNSSYNTSVLGQTGTNADFVIIHWYPGGDAPTLLTTPGQIGSIVNNTRVQLTNNVGAAFAAKMGIAITETGAGNVTGAPSALFAADDFLTWIENGIWNVDYQELHNGFLAADTPGVANNSLLGPANGAKMGRLLANVGDTFLKTTSAQSELHVHATTRRDGNTGIMFINTDPNISISAAVSISGPTLANSGTWYQFGLTNFVGANVYPSYPVSTNTVSGLGNSFTVSIPPYTMVDLLLSPALPNTPPVLAAIGNQTVNVGQTVAFTASATDTDQPPQTLTFSLLNGISSATLNTNSGAFSWRPAVTNANTTNAFTLIVADNGSPILSATQNFSVTVNPLTQPTAASIALNNGTLGFQVTGQAGPDYAVQISSNLLNWSTLFITNSPPMPFSWTDTNPATLPAQFYRVKAGPPLP
jgi:hypothetical protein